MSAILEFSQKMSDAPLSHIEFVKRQLHRWLDELLDSQEGQDLKKSFGKTLTIRNYILSPVLNEHETAVYLNDPEVQDYMTRYQALCADNEVRFERQMSNILRGGHESEMLVQIIKGYYADIYKLLARSEIYLSGMNRTSTVAMVGVGGMPLSLLFMQRFSGARIVGLDKSAESLEAGAQYIDFLATKHPKNYQRDAIKLVCADGSTFDYGECNIIILSIHISNKMEIIRRIIETAPRDRHVVVIERQVRGLGQYFYRNHGFDPVGLPIIKLGTLCSSLLDSTAYQIDANRGHLGAK